MTIIYFNECFNNVPVMPLILIRARNKKNKINDGFGVAEEGVEGYIKRVKPKKRGQKLPFLVTCYPCLRACAFVPLSEYFSFVIITVSCLHFVPLILC